jgi:hypothetical protein
MKKLIKYALTITTAVGIYIGGNSLGFNRGILEGTIKGFDQGMREGRRDIISQLTNQDQTRSGEIESYLRLPQEIRDCDTNSDVRFQRSEVEALYSKNLIPKNCFHDNRPLTDEEVFSIFSTPRRPAPMGEYVSADSIEKMALRSGPMKTMPLVDHEQISGPK